jgi:antitoxin component YwqK of YwqJK toxin-antitoxin module
MQPKKSQYRVQWMFIGSRANDSEICAETKRPREQMTGKERRLYAKYVDIDSRPMNILLDEKKCLDMFSSKYDYYENLYFHKVLDADKTTFKEKIGQFFKNEADASMLVYSGNAMKGTGTWHIESNDHGDHAKDESISFEDVAELWKGRNKKQKHLLILIDSNYAGHWLRKLCNDGASNISIQGSCRYWQRSYEDKEVGGFFLHNLYKVIKGRKSELIIDPKLATQTPCFYGNFHYVMRYFDLRLKFESWPDMRKALGVSTYGDWPRTTIRKPGGKDPLSNFFSNTNVNSEPIFNEDGEEEIPFFYDKNGARYEGNVDRNGNKEGFGVLYTVQAGRLEYEGQFKNDAKNGKGVAYDNQGYQVFEGEWVNNQKVGAGVNFDQNGVVIFQGEFRDDKRNGSGKEFYPNGKVSYIGKYAHGNRTGKGTEYFENGKVKFEGTWKRGKLTGGVIEYFENGVLFFEGEYADGLKNGQGKQFYESGVVHYEGTYQNGQFHGYGIIFNQNGDRLCEGEFIEGQLQGHATTYYLNGNVMYDGEFELGKAIGVGFLREEKGSIHYQGLREQVVREAVVSGIYKERKMTQTFEEKNVITGRKVSNATPEKSNFILESTSKFDQTGSCKQDMANSFVRRVTMDEKFKTKALTSLESETTPRKLSYNPLNPKGGNDYVANLRKSTLLKGTNNSTRKISSTSQSTLKASNKSQNESMTSAPITINSQKQAPENLSPHHDTSGALQSIEDHHIDFEKAFNKAYDPEEESMYFYDRFVPTIGEMEYEEKSKGQLSSPEKSEPSQNEPNPFQEKFKSDLEITPLPISPNIEEIEKKASSKHLLEQNQEETTQLHHDEEAEDTGILNQMGIEFAGSFKITSVSQKESLVNENIMENQKKLAQSNDTTAPQIYKKQQEPYVEEVTKNDRVEESDEQEIEESIKNIEKVIANDPEYHPESERSYELEKISSRVESLHQTESKASSHFSQSSRTANAPRRTIKGKLTIVDDEGKNTYNLNI